MAEKDWWKEDIPHTQENTDITSAPTKDWWKEDTAHSQPEKRVEDTRSGWRKNLHNVGSQFLQGTPVVGHYAPEFLASGQSALHGIFGTGLPGETFGERKNKNLDVINQSDKDFRTSSPWTAGGLRAGGAVAGSVPIAALGTEIGGAGIVSQMLSQGGAFGTTGILDKLVENLKSGKENTNTELGIEGVKGVAGGALGPMLSAIMGPASFATRHAGELDKSLLGATGNVVHEWRGIANKPSIEKMAQDATKLAHESVKIPQKEVSESTRAILGLLSGATASMFHGLDAALPALIAGHMVPDLLHRVPQLTTSYLNRSTHPTTQSILNALGGAGGVAQ